MAIATIARASTNIIVCYSPDILHLIIRVLEVVPQVHTTDTRDLLRSLNGGCRLLNTSASVRTAVSSESARAVTPLEESDRNENSPSRPSRAFFLLTFDFSCFCEIN